MANANLKTDFRNGDILFDYQLNNNFKAIQEALNAMNAIVWQDNADKVVTFRGTTEELMNRTIIDGQILYDTITGESYIDYEGKRISTGSGNAIHIGENEPTNKSTQLWIPNDGLESIGSEVVNSLEGNQERMAPSVAAVNEALAKYYSTEETFTGKYWIDGKKIYRKVVELGNLPNSPTVDGIYVDTPTGLTNVIINKIYGTAYNINSGNVLPLPYVVKNEGLIAIAYNNNNIRVTTYSDRSSYLGYAVLEYTKTTDTVEESEE